MQVRSLCSKLQNGALAAFFSFLILLIAPSGGVFAEDSNSLRIGGDYQFLTLKEGAGFRECRRACRNDVSCKAWTFIKERVRNRKGLNFNLGPDLNIGFGGKKEIIPAQCRLKHTVGPKHANDCCISGVKRVAARRRGNKAERCATYADQPLSSRIKTSPSAAATVAQDGVAIIAIIIAGAWTRPQEPLRKKQMPAMTSCAHVAGTAGCVIAAVIAMQAQPLIS